MIDADKIYYRKNRNWLMVQPASFARINACLLYAAQVNKNGNLMKQKNLLVAFRERYQNQIFVLTKPTFLIWTVALAGMLDKMKTQLLAKHGELLWIYVLFWVLLAGVGVLFSLFWKAGTLNEFEVLFAGLQGGILIPVAFVYVALLVSLSLMSHDIVLAGTIIFTLIPISVGLWVAWGAAIKNSGLINYLTSAFEHK